MKILDVVIENWKDLGDHGVTFWKQVEEKPDEPLIVATIKFSLSHKEYHELLDKSKQ